MWNGHSATGRATSRSSRGKGAELDTGPCPCGTRPGVRHGSHVDAKNDRGFSEPNRWGTNGLEEQALRPKLVVEVRYDKLEKHRFRHGTRLLRFRPDKDADLCTWREVRPPRRKDDLAVEDLLR